MDMNFDSYESPSPAGYEMRSRQHENPSEAIENYDMRSARFKNLTTSMESCNMSSSDELNKSASRINNETYSFHENQFKAMKEHDMCSSLCENDLLPLEKSNMRPSKYSNQHIEMENSGVAALNYGSYKVSMQHNPSTGFSYRNQPTGITHNDLVGASYGYSAFPTQYVDSSLLEPENSYENAVKQLENLLLRQPSARPALFINVNMYLVTEKEQVDVGRFPIQKIQEWRLEPASIFESFPAGSQKVLQASGITNYAKSDYVFLSGKTLPDSNPNGPGAKKVPSPFELDGFHRELLEEYWECCQDWLVDLGEDRLDREIPTIKVTIRREKRAMDINESSTEENSSSKPKMSFQATNKSSMGKMRAALGTGNFIEFDSGRQWHFTAAQIDNINRVLRSRAHEAEMYRLRARFEAARTFDEIDDQEFIPNLLY